MLNDTSADHANSFLLSFVSEVTGNRNSDIPRQFGPWYDDWEIDSSMCRNRTDKCNLFESVRILLVFIGLSVHPPIRLSEMAESRYSGHLAL